MSTKLSPQTAGELQANPITFPVAYWEAEVAALQCQGLGIFSLQLGLEAPQNKGLASDPTAGICQAELLHRALGLHSLALQLQWDAGY